MSNVKTSINVSIHRDIRRRSLRMKRNLFMGLKYAREYLFSVFEKLDNTNSRNYND